MCEHGTIESLSENRQPVNVNVQYLLGCRLLTSVTSPPQYGHHRRIIAISEKSLYTFMHLKWCNLRSVHPTIVKVCIHQEKALFSRIPKITLFFRGIYSCKCPAFWVGKKISFPENGGRNSDGKRKIIGAKKGKRKRKEGKIRRGENQKGKERVMGRKVKEKPTEKAKVYSVAWKESTKFSSTFKMRKNKLVEKYTFNISFVIKVHKLQFIYLWKRYAAWSWLINWGRKCTMTLVAYFCFQIDHHTG